MYVDYCKVHNKNKTYYRALLRESYRENGKVKKRNIANLGACSEEEVKAIRSAIPARKFFLFKTAGYSGIKKFLS
ncbi:MAG: hypothetical protein BECKG1743D_GA0114223_109022 [Candidatus Kentron sp. G]|nr:MAG: hypothetical protein BECKG1743F_GA0114225_107872 [Candidatus Kentron sp. G]VFN04584.1 MAG: hypothetical protein BECKG1743E_GA0114224_107492 [Candidatus Kentron sp. G]VFN06698.1 MAG: hypothetical protein BECKG1743D_GA0114223_109022 [Candidatus Kentron sp. G]